MELRELNALLRGRGYKAMLRFEKVEKGTLGELHSTNDVKTTRKLWEKKPKAPVNDEVELANMLKDSENEKKENENRNGESTDLPKGELE